MDVGRLRPPLGVVELVTLVALVTNRATVDGDALSAALGPVHGVSYLLLVLLAVVARRSPAGARWAAVVPGVGGLLSWWLLRRARTARRPDPRGAGTSTRAADPWASAPPHDGSAVGRGGSGTAAG